MTVRAWVDESGETRLVGTIVPDPGGGSQTVKAVDLGVIDLATVFSSDPILLYAMQPGEYLSTIRFTDTDIVESVPQNNTRMGIGIGTVKSFAWYTFAWLRGVFENTDAFDTLSLTANLYAYGPALVLAPTTITGNSAQVLSAAAAGDIYAGMIDATLPAHSTGVRFKAPAAWAAQTAYGTEVNPTPGTPPLVKAAILANGTLWVNTGTAGTSGTVAPNFAGNAGSSVHDPSGNIGNQDITGVNQGAKTFMIAGDFAALITEAGTVDVNASTGNDGTYTVVSSIFAAGSTTTTVAEAIPDPTVDGSLSSQVPDGPIVWTDTTDPPFTAGTVRAIAEIWAPA